MSQGNPFKKVLRVVALLVSAAMLVLAIVQCVHLGTYWFHSTAVATGTVVADESKPGANRYDYHYTIAYQVGGKDYQIQQVTTSDLKPQQQVEVLYLTGNPQTAVINSTYDRYYNLVSYLMLVVVGLVMYKLI